MLAIKKELQMGKYIKYSTYKEYCVLTIIQTNVIFYTYKILTHKYISGI
jgi:hypothetical protein